MHYDSPHRVILFATALTNPDDGAVRPDSILHLVMDLLRS